MLPNQFLIDEKGRFESIVAFIGGSVNSKTTITFPHKDLALFLLQQSSQADYIEPKSFTIIHSDHDLDSQLYPQIFDQWYQGSPYWTKGTTFTYLLRIKDCDTTAFCNVFKNFVTDLTQDIQLEGIFFIDKKNNPFLL